MEAQGRARVFSEMSSASLTATWGHCHAGLLPRGDALFQAFPLPAMTYNPWANG